MAIKCYEVFRVVTLSLVTLRLMFVSDPFNNDEA